jgi:hypothetical protein
MRRGLWQVLVVVVRASNERSSMKLVVMMKNQQDFEDGILLSGTQNYNE